MRSLDEIVKIASALTGSKFLPEAIRNDTPSLVYLIMTAEELGLNTAYALRSLYPTREGGVGITSQAVLALLYKHGFKVKIVTSTAEMAHVKVWRPEEKEEDAYEAVWTMEKAAAIPIWKDGKWQALTSKYNWSAYPKDMLFWRAIMEAARRKAPDIIAGIYMLDEIEDIPQEQPEVAPSKRFRVVEKTAADVPESPAQETSQADEGAEAQDQPPQKSETEPSATSTEADTQTQEEDLKAQAKKLFADAISLFGKEAAVNFVRQEYALPSTKSLRSLPPQMWIAALEKLLAGDAKEEKSE